MSGRTPGSGRKRGSRNKRTLQREAAIRKAEQQALVGLKSTDDVQLANSKVVLNEAMKYFFGRARATKDPEERGDHYIAASAIAEKLIGFEFPKLATVRVGEDRENPFPVREGVTSAELRAELLDMFMRGMRPSDGALPELMDLSAEGASEDSPVEATNGVANREE